MLNSVGTAARVRMTPDERRRQLVGIGLRMFVERPVGDLSVDDAQLWSDSGELLGSARQTRRTMPSR